MSEPVQINSGAWLMFLVYQIDATHGAVVLASGTSSPKTTALAIGAINGAIRTLEKSEVTSAAERARRRIDIVTPLRR